MIINMSTENMQEPQTELINKVRERSESEAGNDDIAFVKKFREIYFEEQSKLAGGLRNTSQVHKLTPNNLASVINDRRFASNARKMIALPQRIVGGTEVSGTYFNDCVAILFGGEGSNYQSACTGTLISKNTVVTAGHCQCEGNASRIFVGNNIDSEGEMVKVSRQLRHPRYDSDNHNDLMVIVLESEINGVQPRKIAPMETIDSAIYGRAVGFGNTDPNGLFGYGIKRQVDLPIVSNSCQAMAHGMNDQNTYNCDPGLELVAGKPLLAKDTCTGDSGGPLYVLDGNDEWLLAGATSRGTPNTVHRCGDGGIYVRVDKYLDWIRSVVDIQI
jgi:endonuclease G